jgi:energy-coupling factor transporter ATP-binding protein EcfA2
MGEIKDLSIKNLFPKRENNFLFPRSIRGLIIGKSGCGKTTLLLNLLLQPKWLDYEKLFVFGKSLFQPEYKLIKHAFEKNISKENLLSIFENNQTNCYDVINYLSKNQFNHNPIESTFYELVKDVPDPRELNRDKNNLMIFDDLLLEKQNKCEDYYVRGRHSNVDCFYLAQNYFKLPRQTIRENTNFICLFKQDLKNITHIYNDHVSNDMDFSEFKSLCSKCWEDKHSFLVIDLSSEKCNGKFRKGFTQFYIPNS